MNKRVLIGIALAIVGLIAVTSLGLLLAGDDRRLGAASAGERSFVAKRYALEIAGVNVGTLSDAEGCGVGADVVKEQVDASGVVKKHISNPVYDPCVIRVGLEMDKTLYDWISDMLARKQSAKNLAIVAADYDYKERARTTLSGAYITKVSFPALDAQSKDSASIELTIQPESSQTVPGSGATVKGQTGSAKSSKKWTLSNFRFRLGSDELARTSRISALEATQEIVQGDIGESRLAGSALGPLQLGDLKFAIAVADSSVVDKWFEDFVVKGTNAEANEKSATIEYLSANLKDVLATLSLSGVGIFKVSEDVLKETDKKASVATKSYELYIEQASFVLGRLGVVTMAPPPPPPPPSTTATTTTTTTAPPTPTSAQGQILVPSAISILDGETFTLADGVNPPVIFEFDSNGVSKGVPIRIGKEETADKVAVLVAEAVNGIARGLDITAKPGTGVVALGNDSTGTQGNILISDTVIAKGFVPKGMSGGTGEAKPALAVPTGLTAASGLGAGEIDLSWQPTPGAESYVVLMKTDPDGPFRELEETKEPTFGVAGLRSGAVHYFAVYAVYPTGDSANSNEVSATAG